MSRAGGGWVLAAALLAGLGAPLVVRAAPPILTDADLPEHVPNRVLVVFRPGAPQAAREAFVLRSGCVLNRHNSSPHFIILEIPPALVQQGASVTAAMREFVRDPAVFAADPDYIRRTMARPNDTQFGELWGMHNIGQTVQGQRGTADADIDAVEAWDVTPGDPTIRVAVVDTGVDYNHVDLAANIARDAQGNLIGTDTEGQDDNDPMDTDGHGTHVAGTIGAVGNNSEGVTGVCQRVAIMPIRAGGGSFASSDLIQAYDFAMNNGARVINASLGGYGVGTADRQAAARIHNAGILFVAAAGNDTNDNDVRPAYPASFSSEFNTVIAVAATDNRDQIASFSNYGLRNVNIGAPGVSILSTRLSGGYEYLQGTSMAAPHVAGAAGLVLATSRNLAAAELRTRLESTGDANSALTGRTTSGRRLNVFNAIRIFQLTDPNGGEAARVGSNVSITWDSKGFPTTNRVKIDLSRDGGLTYPETLAAAEIDDGQFDWTVTGPLSDQCRVRITASLDITQKDASDADFRIVDGSLDVDAPNGGEIFLYGQTVDIEWTALDFAGPADNPTVNIDLSRDGGATWAQLFTNTPNDGIESWTATAPATPDALIRVTAVAFPEFTDESDDVFEIREPPSVTLTHPNGGETFVEGRPTTITWDSTGVVDDVRIELSRNGGITYETLFPQVPNIGELDWVVTGPTTRLGRFRITSVDDPTVSDRSNGVFSVVAASLTVTAPVSRQNILQGQRETIRWTSRGMGAGDDVVIEFSGDGGDTWDVVTPGAPNTGSFPWDVDVEPSENALIRVSSADFPEVFAISAGFTVRTPTLFLTSPNGGDNWQIGSQAIVRWSGTSIGHGTVDILLSKDGGRSFPIVLKSATPNDGGEAVGVAGPANNKARVRIVWRPAVRVAPEIEDRSDRNFKIRGGRKPRRGR